MPSARDAVRAGFTLAVVAAIAMLLIEGGVRSDLGFVELAPAAWAKEKPVEQSAELRFRVVRQDNGKPLRNASVVLHQLDKNGRQRDTFQLKTDNEGRASVDGIPYGKLRVQVIMRGLQTFGEDYEVNQSVMEFQIELKPPKDPLSIY